jgi:hypothetical protein
MNEPLTIYLRNKITKVDDTYIIDGKSVSEFLKDWVKSDGKNFFDLGNTGGGSSGNSKGDMEKFGKFFDKKSDQYNITEQIKLKKQNPDLYKILSDKYGG